MKGNRPSLHALRSVKTLREFAPLLGFAPKGLAYTLYKIPDANRYRTFTIPKKGGGERTISSPEPRIGLLQSNLARLLADCVDEIEATETRRRSVSHGFHRRRSIVTNARAHRNKRYVLNLDLADFFGSINFGRVRGLFINDHHFTLDPAVATIIAQIACHKNALPQGAPSSPVISNLVGNILDTRLARLSKRYSCHYTRYADDLTLSTNAKAFPELLAGRRRDSPNIWEPGDALRCCIERTGFAINDAKTRMQIRGTRQEATGLIVNEKVNVKPESYRIVRSMCHSLFRTGYYFIPVEVDDDDAAPTQLKNLAPLEGRLSHIYYVKDRRDLDAKAKKDMKFQRSLGFETLYRQFLIYKYFIASELPVVVTEGKTDIIYLRCAIKALKRKCPVLVQDIDGRTYINIRFVNPTYVNQRVLKLGNGFVGMRDIIARYEKLLMAYNGRAISKPVIFVIDNDSGGEEVFKMIRSELGINVRYESPETFYYLTRNLYLVKTPSEGANQSCIEDLFSQNTRSILVDGKPFDKNKMHGDHTAYGKLVFADRVIRSKVDQIDFGKFAPLLEGIAGSITHFGEAVSASNRNGSALGQAM